MPSPRQRILFFARVADDRLLDILEYYRNDIEALKSLGYEVELENRATRALWKDADLLYAWWWVPTFPVVAAWRLRGRPSVVTGATDFRVPVVPLHKKLVKNVLTRMCARLADHNLTISEHELREIRRSAPGRSSVLYPGVDTDFFAAAPRTDEPTAVTVGRVHPTSIRRKGIDLAMAATPLVRREVPSYRLKVVGRVTSEGSEWIAAAGDRDDLAGVEVSGELSREEKRTSLGSAWAYLQPSAYEGFGMAVVEAMACSTPVICSSAGALPEVVGDAAKVLESRTVECLANAILEMLRSDGLRQDLGARGRLRAERFSMARRTEGLREVLRLVGDTG